MAHDKIHRRLRNLRLVCMVSMHASPGRLRRTRLRPLPTQCSHTIISSMFKQWSVGRINLSLTGQRLLHYLVALRNTATVPLLPSLRLGDQWPRWRALGARTLLHRPYIPQ